MSESWSSYFLCKMLRAARPELDSGVRRRACICRSTSSSVKADLSPGRTELAMRPFASKDPHQERDQLRIAIDHTSPELTCQSLNGTTVERLGAHIPFVRYSSAMTERFNPLLRTDPHIIAIK
ncbi:hypothetical protein HBH56_236770 [Parastagonospora nodorum]|uniref:Uncharacterized protein n=1 Tax=Phaeosphaeria nodorum (strain SN15 / ATCC MYA-4574 / FGSC 10173) TaxID=321614 RepID=A0A7U2EQ09_PHANO|nr:hypothetical protein HBH56_236770 [Parastagonospora nodorum]QRC90894.1 hypothetical protein JI435_426060 [Parastagonospora nodorum SN15]KAH3934920.1 hypothetical protein HBH54_045960 [Parastagonospora nodorum]KAH4110768.1 hypothetical protein HBH46_009340 [Parastagonospora nodorum]KAH4135633.1 hypothetical protein HBH45_151160 [Parastagonospora nodorum]